MKEIKAIIPAKDKWCSIVWQVNDVCNFRCSYCNEWNWGGRNKNTEVEPILDCLDSIIEHYQSLGYKYFKLFLSGGEPTIWQNLVPVVEHFRKKVTWPGSCVGINTNFSRPQSWWQEHYQLFEDVVATYHSEFTNEEKYIKNYQFLCDKINYLCARVMMKSESFQDCINFTDRLKSTVPNYIIEYAPVYNELMPSTAPYHYDEEWKMNFFETHNTEKSHTVAIKNKNPIYAYSLVQYEDDQTEPISTNQIITSKKNYFKGWQCNINESLHIYPDGSINMASCGSGPSVGNIIQNKFNVARATPIICPKEHCHCAADLNIPKAKVNYEQNLLRN